MQPATFLSVARPLLGKFQGLNTFAQLHEFKRLFGVTPLVCALVWKSIGNAHPEKSKFVHLLYALLFLKTYANEQEHRAITGTNEKTFRYWCWIFIWLISELNVVSTNFTHTSAL